MSVDPHCALSHPHSPTDRCGNPADRYSTGDEVDVTFRATYGYPSTREPGSHYVWVTDEFGHRTAQGPIPASQIRPAPTRAAVSVAPVPEVPPCERCGSTELVRKMRSLICAGCRVVRQYR